MKCPKDNHRMRKGKIPYRYKNCCYLGDFEAYVCPKCNSVYYTEKGYNDIMKVDSKKLFVHGTNVSITYSIHSTADCCVHGQWMKPLDVIHTNTSNGW